EVEAAEGRAAIAGDERGGVQPAALVGSVLVEGQADQRLDAGQEDEALFLTVLGVQGEITLGRHAVSSRGAEASGAAVMIRAALMGRNLIGRGASAMIVIRPCRLEEGAGGLDTWG